MVRVYMVRSKRNTTKRASREFTDKDRAVMSEYYEILDTDHDTEDIRKLIKRDPDFYDPYLYVANDLRKLGRETEARELEDEVFKRASRRVEDKEGNWPDEMRWGFLENRHVIRALMTGADNLWRDGKTEETLVVYRKLFRSNLNDNIGARYAIIALRLGLPYEEYMRQVWPQSRMPAEHMDTWFRKHAPKFPEELVEWKQYCKDEIGLNEEDL